MDPITHGLIGTLGSRTGFSQKSGRIATIAFLIGAIFPDLDILVALGGPDFSLRYHRGITHSVIAAPFFAIFLAALIYRFTSYKNLLALALMVGLGIYSHIFFDLITSYGTVIFDPISMKRYSWNLVFIIDPFITIPALLGLILCWKFKGKAILISFSVLVFLVFYMILSLALKSINEDKLTKFAYENTLDVKKSTLYPLPLAPIFWMGIIETEDAFYKINFSMFKDGPTSIKEISRTSGNSFISLANELEITSLYKWFADYPVAQYRQSNGEHIVEFYDLRFNIISAKNPFILKIIYSRDGNLKDISLNGRYVGEAL